MATYPTNPALPAGTASTEVNTTNWNTLIDNINAIGADLVDARGDGQAFPGTDHSAGQATDLDDILQAIKHEMADISGETNWYDIVPASLKAHDHSTGKGGSIPWSSIGNNARKLELHPQYPGALWTKSLRGAAPSGNNTGIQSNDQDVVSNVARNYYNWVSSQTSLHDYYVALRFTLPKDFNIWTTSNALQIEFRTGSAMSSDSHVDLYIYKSETANLICSSENNANLNWSTVSMGGSTLGSWLVDDIMEIYIKLESKSNNYARIGKISFSYSS